MFRLSGTKTIPILLLLLALCGISPRSDALEPLRIATEGAYPPFSFFDAEGRLTGFDVEIAQALCQRLDRECQISAVPWNELLPGLRAGRYALIVASMAKTAEREQYGDFTKPFSTAFTKAWRTELTAYAESVLTGGTMTVDECLANLQKAFDEVIALN